MIRRLVIDLLVSMGYGGTFEDAAQVVGKSGDGGIDGIIKEDRLGLDVIHVQAKRWDGVVGRPEVQRFVGALKGHRAKKGVFITTSSISSEARAYAEGIDSKVILIDGRELVSQGCAALRPGLTTGARFAGWEASARNPAVDLARPLSASWPGGRMSKRRMTRKIMKRSKSVSRSRNPSTATVAGAAHEEGPGPGRLLGGRSRLARG